MEELQINVGMILVDKTIQIRYRIIAIQNREAILCRMETTKLNLTLHPLQTLKQLLFHKEWELLSSDQLRTVDYDKLSGALKVTFEKKKAAIQQAEKLFAPTYLGLFSSEMKTNIANICQDVGISRATFWKAMRVYLQSGFDMNSLLDGRQTHGANISAYQTKTGRPAQYGATSTLIITPEIKKQFDDGIAVYKSGRSQTLYSAYLYVMENYYSEEIYTDNGVTISVLPITERPTFRQFSYYAGKVLSKKDIDIIKTSRREYRNDKRLLLSDSLKGVYGPGDCVEIDECEVDISLVSSVNHEDTVGRPILYFMVDIYTRAIIAFSVSFENNSTLGLTTCLMSLSDDKVKFCQEYGIETSADDWIPGFIPKRIRCDRGAEYRGKRAEQVFNELGITRELVSPATGSLKGVVEHMFYQFHQDINPHTEGIGQIQKRYDSKHHQQATLDIHDFTAMVIAFVLKHNHSYMDQYPRTKDMYAENIVPTPIDLWRYGVNKYGNPRPISNQDQYIYTLMEPVSAKISRSGLTWKNLNYLNMMDPYFRNRMIGAERKFETFEARMDPRCINTLYYLRSGVLERATLNRDKTGNSDFAGMTMKEYELFYRQKKQQDKAGNELNLQMRVATESVYNEIVSTGKKVKPGSANNKNLRENRKAERFLVNAENSIESRLSESELPPPVVPTENITPAPSLFEIDSLDPNASDYWAAADYAARMEEKEKQEYFRKGDFK